MKRHWGTLQQRAPHPPPASGPPRSFKLSRDAAASHAAHKEGDGGGEARKWVRIACRHRKHARRGAFAKGESRQELYRQFSFFFFKGVSSAFFFPLPHYQAASPTWIRSAEGDLAQSWGQEQSASKETRNCNSVQLQRVSLQSMIWTPALFILTCFSGWPSVSSTPRLKTWMV